MFSVENRRSDPALTGIFVSVSGGPSSLVKDHLSYDHVGRSDSSPTKFSGYLTLCECSVVIPTV
jgi:hypothetical protein